jgi:type I restriction enzyme, S subunit
VTELVVRTLPEILSFIVDNRGRSCPTAERGIPLIATNCLKPGVRSPVFENIRHVSDETYRTWFRAHPEPGDVLFVCKGSPGRVAVVPDPVPFCIAQDMVALRADPTVVDPLYLYYRLASRDVQNSINTMHVGTMIPHFKKGDFGKLRFTVHESLTEQRAIAEMLGALDDKIAANDRVIASADELARVHFKAAAEHGEETPLSSLARFVNGKAFTKDATGTGRVVVRIAELNSGIGSSTVYNDIEVADDHTARPGDLLFAWSGSLTAVRWYRPEAVVNQHIFKVIPNSGVPMWLVNQAVLAKLGEFKAIAADKATTMGHIQRHHLDEPVVVPTKEKTAQLDGLMTGLWEDALSVEIENLKLAQTRDELMPLLMSGNVRIRDVEQQLVKVAI